MVNNDEYLRNAFSSFDKDGNGFIDLYELTQALTEESTPNSGVIRAIMNEVDTDKVRPVLDSHTEKLVPTYRVHWVCFFWFERHIRVYW